MKIKPFFISLLLGFALFSCGFQWPWDANQKKASKPAPIKKVLAQTNSKPNASDEKSGGWSEPNAEIQKVQTDLERIADQTKGIQDASGSDRVRLQKIVEQAEIQRRLLESLKVTNLSMTASHANTEEVIRAAKVRLIAEDVKRTQETLKTIQSIPKARTTISTVPNISKRVSE